MLTGDIFAVFLKDLYKVFFYEDDIASKNSKINDIYNVSSIKGEGEKETQLLGFDNLEEMTEENGFIPYESPKQGWSSLGKQRIFTKGFTVSYKAKVFTVKLQNLVETFITKMSNSRATTKEEYAARPFNYGDVTTGDSIFDGSFLGEADPSGNLLYDGVCLFNASGNLRYTKNGGSYYNCLTGKTLNVSNYRELLQLHRATNGYNEMDKPIINEVDTLLVPRGDYEYIAEEILFTYRGKPESDYNTKNVLANKGVNPLTWHYINPNRFFVGKRKHPTWQWYQKSEPDIQIAEDSTNAQIKVAFLDYWGAHFKVGAWKAWAMAKV